MFDNNEQIRHKLLQELEKLKKRQKELEINIDQKKKEVLIDIKLEQANIKLLLADLKMEKADVHLKEQILQFDTYMLSKERDLFFREQKTSYQLLEIKEGRMYIEYKEKYLEVARLEMRVEMREKRVEISKYALEIMKLVMQQERDDMMLQHRSNQLDLREDDLDNKHRENKMELREEAMRIQQRDNVLKLAAESLKIEKEKQEAFMVVREKLLEAKTQKEEAKIIKQYADYEVLISKDKEEINSVLHKAQQSELKAKALKMNAEIDMRSNQLTIDNAMHDVNMRKRELDAMSTYDEAHLERMKSDLNKKEMGLMRDIEEMEEENYRLKQENKEDRYRDRMSNKNQSAELKRLSEQVKYFKTGKR